MFAEITRIVAKWYGDPKSEDVFPQIFEDAIHVWKTGEFEGESVFQAEDPGGMVGEQPNSGVRSTYRTSHGFASAGARRRYPDRSFEEWEQVGGIPAISQI